jgi:flagellar capping protein FliD
VSAQPLEIRMAHLEGAYEQISHRLGNIEQRLGSMELKFEGRLGKIDGRFAQMDGRFAQMDRKFMWLIGLVGSSWITTMLAVLYHR